MLQKNLFTCIGKSDPGPNTQTASNLQAWPTPLAKYPADYQGIAYTDIVKQLQTELGGEPKDGERNNFLLKMAQHMSYICDKDPKWLASILPRYGQEQHQFMSTLESACNYQYNATYYRRIMNLVDRLQGVCGLLNQPPEMPAADSLPPFIQAVIKGSPEEVQPGVALAAFAPAGCYLHKTLMIDSSGRPTEPSFQTIFIAPSGSGKSSVDHPIQCLMAPIKQRDEESRRKQQEWKEKIRTLPKNQELPKRPVCPLQFLANDITSAAFMRIMKENNAWPALIATTELDSLRKMNDGKDPAELLRAMDDHAEYGKEREGSDFESIKVKLYTNIVASSTVKQAQDFFGKSIGKGNIHRLTLCTIIKDEDDWNETIPVYENHTPEYQQSLLPFIEQLKLCNDKTYNVAQAKQWAEKLQKRLADTAKAHNDRIYGELIGRAVKSGFWRAMMLYLMAGEQWAQDIEDFATWSVEYDLWCKMKIFGTALSKEREKESIIPLSASNNTVYDQLPDQFTKAELIDLYNKEGKSSVQATNLLIKWRKRSKVIFIEKDKVYRKI